MKETPAKILRIYVSNTDTLKHDSLYECLAHMAQENEMQGVTVYKGIMGFGASSQLRSTKFWSFTEKVPVTIEIIDESAKIENFIKVLLPILEKHPKGLLIIKQDIEIVLSKKGIGKTL